ncbi:hypothetical protein ETD86_40385 [Nonomuraea turkmeniaca]|uniref:Uncharacterized protein n=1 Tax=Nonomuraea turkmeniaca TaxID=103838 RepID=A0A5S4F297_9ACTN|nr:hypothetical protein [Nonomuraea turkmeniaca]TMR10235.1 hypothetical protein ETD86_40385 [Nonomuraea turkmeniaca]
MKHCGLAVAAWCLYEGLQTPDILGGRLPARARRCWVAAQLGVSERTLDRARAELLADDGGPFLVRQVRGRNRSALHLALGRPQETAGRTPRYPPGASPASTPEPAAPTIRCARRHGACMPCCATGSTLKGTT